MDTFMNFLMNIHGGVMSLVLMIAIVIDTVLALRTRVPRGLFLSKKMITGIGLNMVMAFVPLICGVMSEQKFLKLNDVDILTLRIAMIVVAVSVGLGVVGSCIANYAIAFPNAKFAWAIAEKLIPHELSEKIQRLEGEKDVDAIKHN